MALQLLQVEIYYNTTMTTDINVFMMGGRRCGKTTVLALIREHFNKVLHHEENEGNDLLRLVGEKGEITNLNDALDALACYFNGDYDPYTDFPVDDNQSTDTTTTVLKLSPISGKDSLRITFRDVPGEWFSTPEHIEDIQNWIHEAQVLILAVDTPSLFAENGFYTEYYNRIKNISDTIEGALSGDYIASPLSHKMLLIVPLKCENIIIDKNGDISTDGMERVKEKVKEQYAELIDRFKQDPYREKMTMAILPISTIREMRWHKFGCILDGKEASIFRDNGEPRRFDLHYDAQNHPFSIYRFRSPVLFDMAVRNGSQSYYCEQPMIYTLVYLMRYVAWLKHGAPRWWEKIPLFGKLVKMLTSLFNLFSDNSCYEVELQRLRTKKMKRRNGFEILQNPLDI